MGTEHFRLIAPSVMAHPACRRARSPRGLYPQPPDLVFTSKRYTAAGLFWIVKHGIRMIGMPGWGDHSDDELWAMVAFVKKLPEMTEQDYDANLTTASRGQGSIMRHRPGRHRNILRKAMTIPPGTIIDAGNRQIQEDVLFELSSIRAARKKATPPVEMPLPQRAR